jgi:hypothetical protein
MTDKNKVESRLEALGSELRSQKSVVGDVMARVNVMPCPARTGPERKDAVIWRLIMNKYARMAAVAAMLTIVAIVVVTTIDKTTPAAYALEQTIAAIRDVRFVHMTEWSVGKDEPLNIWMEYSDTGEPLRIRLSFPEWKNPGDGAKEVLWQDNVAQVYKAKNNMFITISEKKILREFRKLASALDAGELFKRMATIENVAERKVEVAMPSGDQDKIIITSSFKGLMQKFYVDPATKLLSKMETFTIDAEGKEKLVATMNCDYARPETDVFAIQAPEGTTNIDMVNTVIGIPQGEMTDEQAAKETVRQFWQALIDSDYRKAGGIFSGFPEDKMKETFGRARVISIVSIEEPIVDDVSRTTGGYRVKCVVELEYNGKTGQQQFGPLVRKGDDQAHPDNWVINGGI